MNTSCKQCLFADYSISDHPCKFNIIDLAKKYHQVTTKEDFNYIIDYRCPYAFGIDYYKENKESIGTVKDLENELVKRASIAYYLIIKITNIENISETCSIINSMSIKPRFISFLLYKQNNTKTIIEQIKSSLNSDHIWKIHNFLEDIDDNDKLSSVIDITHQNVDFSYFWFNIDDSNKNWVLDIESINRIITLEQPYCNAIFRSENHDGLVLTYDVYKNIKTLLNSNNILDGLKSIENHKFIYYA